MIIRKPYAFLIKNFKLIHFVLFVFLSYILYKYTSIFGFFNDYAKNGFYTFQVNLQDFYIGFDLLITIILVLVFSVILFLLLKWKDKPTKFYIATCIFYFIAFIFLMTSYNALSTIQMSGMNIRSVRVYRDLSLIFTLPQFFFVIFSLIRGIGFDIKNFEFKKDLEELNIEVEDDEEVELVIVKDTYKIPRFFRKMLRNIKYFILEKKFLAILLFSIVSLIIIISVYFGKVVNNTEYKENDTFVINSLVMKVLESYSSNIDYKGVIINSGKSYIVVKIKVENNTTTRRKIETDKFVININGKNYYPIFTKSNYFLDLGIGYEKENIKSSEEKDVLLIYEIDEKITKNNYTLRVLNQVNVEKEKINANYKEIKLTPKNYNNIGIIDEYNIGSEMLFGDSMLKKTSLTVNKYEMSSSFEEKFNYCANKVCFDGKKVINSDIVGKSEKVLIKLETISKIDDSIDMYRYVKNSTNIFKYFGSIKYTINGKEKLSALNVVSYTFINNNNVYIEVPVEVKTASKIELFLTIRDNKYGIILK